MLIRGIPILFASLFVITCIACGFLLAQGIDDIGKQDRGLGTAYIVVAITLMGTLIANMIVMVEQNV